MIAELAIANAAFAVIKETVANGGDIMAAGKHLFSFFDNKAAIAKKANASGSDSEAFFALEQIKQSEEELKELMIYCGRAAGDMGLGKRRPYYPLRCHWPICGRTSCLVYC